MPLRILIVEDDHLFRDALRDILNMEGFVADGVGSVTSYLAWRSSHTCDVLIVDRNLPDGDGIDVIKVHRQTESGPVIIVSAKGLAEDRIQGINADADYYFVKPIVTDELVSLLLRLSRKTESFTQQGSVWMLSTMNWRLRRISGEEIALTGNERALLSCFVEKPGVTLSKKELIEALGESVNDYDHKRLETLTRRLRSKIHAAGIEDWPLIAVYGKGYAFNGQLSKF